MPGQALQSPAHIDQLLHLHILCVELSHLRIHLQRAIQRDVQLIGHHLSNGVHEGVGKIHHTSHIPQHTLCRHRTESYDLHHLVRAILSTDIVNDLLPAIIAKIDVDIGHGHTLRI